MKQIFIKSKDVLATLSQLADERGLLFLGVSSLDVKQDFKWFQDWLSEGRQAGMTYLERHPRLREHPESILEGKPANSAFCFAMPYQQGDRWRRGEGHVVPKIAMYARLKDYHRTLKHDLSRIAESLKESLGDDFSYRVTVDSAPLLERALAANTTSGFIGKNTCYIHPKHGSFLLLGEILSTWRPQLPEVNSVTEVRKNSTVRTPEGGCGTCRRCQVHCPTGALDEDYRIDARKCLSWWTIENRGPIPEEYWPWIGQYVFGCDICQLVCPWNRGKSPQAKTFELLKLKDDIDPFATATMTQAVYENLFGGTPVTRAKREGLIRNALIALHIRNDPRLEDALAVAAAETHPAITETIVAIRRRLQESQSPNQILIK